MARWLRRVATAQFERNAQRVDVLAGESPCVRCGRPTKRDASEWLEITIDGEVLEVGDPRSNVDNVSQGCFPIGRDCVRKLEVR